MVFIAAGMGGGTGTGAAAVIARAAKELGILTVGIVTKPFQFEGARRMRIAEAGIAEIRKHVDTLIVIPNQNLFRIANEKTTFAEAFVLADQVLYSGVACIVDLIIKEGLINLDFADVRTVMSGMGSAVMGTGEASGDGRASIAAEEAIANPLLDDVSLKGAKGLLLSITGGRDLTLYEVDEAASRVRQEVDPEANIIVGATFDETLGDRVRVSIVASGMARLGEHCRRRCRRQSIRASARCARRQRRRRWPSAASGSAACAVRIRSSTQPDEDMQRRLSEAIGVSGDEGPRESQAPQQRETWRAPGNVVIEEGFAHMQLGGRRRLRAASAHRRVMPMRPGFIPAPPAELRRGAAPHARRRRLPAGRAARVPRQGRPAPPPSGGRRRRSGEEPPRRGILQRIIGPRARRGRWSDPPTSNAAPDPRRMSNSSSDDWWAAERDSQDARRFRTTGAAAGVLQSAAQVAAQPRK